MLLTIKIYNVEGVTVATSITQQFCLYMGKISLHYGNLGGLSRLNRIYAVN